jgi:hypothetical protein
MKEDKRGWKRGGVGGERAELESTSGVARTSWGVSMGCMRCVYRGGSREGGPDGVWCEEGVAFRRVWVLWGAYGDARLKLMFSLPLPFLSLTSRHTSRLTFLAAWLSRSRSRSVYCDVKHLGGGMIRTGVFHLKSCTRASVSVTDKSVWLARASRLRSWNSD